MLHLLLTAALAATTTIATRTGPYADTADITWRDHAGHTQALGATMPPGSLEGGAILSVDHEALAVEYAAALRAWSEEHKVPTKVGVTGTKVTWASSAANKVRVSMAYEAVKVEVLRQHHLARRDPRTLKWDLGQLAADHAPAVSGLARSVGPMLVARELAARTISLAQDIRYQKGDKGTFRTPLAVLRDNRGDCDEKAVLFAALIRSVDPSVPLAIVSMEGHAFVGIGIAPLPGEQVVELDGKTWVVAESAGEALKPLGSVSSDSTEAIAAQQVWVWPVP